MADTRLKLLSPRPQRLDLFYPQVELLRAQRAVRRERAQQRAAKVLAAALMLGLYWLFFTHMR